MIIRASTRFAAVLGWPVAHSRSPALHNAAFEAARVDAAMLALAVDPARLADAVRGLAAVDCLGASVTVPHKEAVMALCDHVEDTAQEVGAVNCLAFNSGRLIGHNTDVRGFLDALREADLARPGDAIVLGGGGAARAVAAALAMLDLGVTVVARYPDRVTWCRARPWSALSDLLLDARLLVDATSAALEPESDRALAASVALDNLQTEAAVVSLVYHRDSALTEAARARGLRTLDGRGMLLHQAARAFTIWTGRAAPMPAMRLALDLSLGG